MSILIAYYSWSGNIRKAAEAIQKKTGGILFEIIPEPPYTSSYNAVVNQAKEEIRKGFKPALVSLPRDMVNYDTIFIGSPNWWSTLAPPVSAFLGAFDFSGKTVIPFISHGGGGLANCASDMAVQCPGSKTAKPFAFYGEANEAELDSWLAETGAAR
ncbi:flavodoxin [Breznakiella homolactica]|uniref:Flavodoxin n=1 Tax=Breznakiella homolactica TaxID=2798577 RepID=A0A7T8BA24_9SPIR|nr:flavodoxin [Breznakiella homolactica]QQO07788.1 flavodoxin [Breznakiella homolactica]